MRRQLTSAVKFPKFRWFQVFSKYIPCLHDSNVKLNLYALQVLHIITPSIARPLASSAVLNLTVQTVISNLASKNEEIFTTTSAVLDGFENSIGEMFLNVVCVLGAGLRVQNSLRESFQKQFQETIKTPANILI